MECQQERLPESSSITVWELSVVRKAKAQRSLGKRSNQIFSETTNFMKMVVKLEKAVKFIWYKSIFQLSQ